MRILIIGGIYRLAESSRALLSASPEMNLELALRRKGFEVGSWPHTLRPANGHWDVVHVHHFGRQVLLTLFGFPRRSYLVFTRHGTGPFPTGWRRLLLTRILRQADAVIALSEHESVELTSLLPAERVHVIPNGTDDAAWPYVEHKPPQGDKPWRLLVVGQLIALKRVDFVLEAVKILKSDFNIELHLIYHNNKLEDTLRAQAMSLGIAKDVVFRGALGGDKLHKEYVDAHLLVSASSTEALPSVLTEAMLTGLPIVACPVGGIPEQLAGFGYLIDGASARAVADAVRLALVSYSGALGNAALAQESARKRYSMQAMGEAHVRLYESLLND